jgi:competence protein ComEC
MNWKWCIALVLLCVFSFVRWNARFHVNKLKILFFDVGQGDSALIQFPRGSTLLIDGGGGWKDRNLGERELFMELTRLSILRLDKVALSHPDQDHAYGLLGIFRTFPVGSFWFNRFSWDVREPKPLLKSIVDTAITKRVEVEPVSDFDQREIEGVTVTRLPVHYSGQKSNNRSLVLILEYRGCRLFFGGDIEKAAETEVMKYLEPITLLKVSHHGSRTSSTPEFLDSARPKVGVISVGRGNQYGHPHELVLKRLRYRGIQTFRTDFHGFLRFEITPEGKLFCESALGSCGWTSCRR